MNDLAAADVLDRAACLVEQAPMLAREPDQADVGRLTPDGRWRKVADWRDAGHRAYTATGAIAEAAITDTRRDEVVAARARNALRTHLADGRSPSEVDLTEWNNNHTQAEVASALRAASQAKRPAAVSGR